MQDLSQNKIPQNASLKDFINLERYFQRKPAIFNKYYETNLLEILDKLPPLDQEQRQKFTLQSTKNIAKKKQKQVNKIQQDQKLQQKRLISQLTLAYCHDVDRMNQDTQINQYSFVGLLGRGAHSVVRLCKSSKQEPQGIIHYACKILCFDKIRKKYFIKQNQIIQMVLNQIQLLKQLKHTKIIGFKQAIYLKQKERVFVILQHCIKGTITKLVNNNLTLEDEQWWEIVRRYFKQFIEGVKFIHSKNIVHRDIKPQNLLINNKDQLKIIDFNVSTRLDHTQKIKITNKFIGTKGYAAPQLILNLDKEKQCNAKNIDMWAIGITLIQLLERRHPYPVKTAHQLVQVLQNYGRPNQKNISDQKQVKIYKNYYQYKLQINSKYPSDLQDLLSKKLKFNNEQRISIQNVAQHKWITKK